MFQQHNIITAIEMGTSKICVLIGETSSDEKLAVIGFGECPSNNSVIKGEIVDMDTALEQLTKAIAQADESSNRAINDSNIIALSITGASILSYQGSGTVFVHNEDNRIGDEEIATAVQNAQSNNIPYDRTLINSFDSYFLLDGQKRVRNPIDMIAHKLEVCIHAVHGKTNQIENFYSLLRDAGFDDDPAPVFSGIASAYGVLTDEEKENGALLLDMGAGTCEYLAIFNMGILASGVLPVGFEHLANDLSLGLDLHISDCRKLFQEGTIVEHIQQRKVFVETPTGPGGVRKIPLASFEKIIDLRLRETFQIIHAKLAAQNILQNLGSGGIISGGGASLPRSSELFREVFHLPVRVGQPFASNGATAGIEDPRYATAWGTLKFAEEFNQIINSKQKTSIAEKILNSADGVASRFLRSLSDVYKSLKI
ncbi:MAG: cell division protein FtsA [Victivallaceae bacterium]|nr:cell division protein FtsA [Victivallaceae bacterium]